MTDKGRGRTLTRGQQKGGIAETESKMQKMTLEVTLEKKTKIHQNQNYISTVVDLQSTKLMY